MDHFELKLEDIYRSEYFDEASYINIDDFLHSHPSYVDFFVQKLESEPENMEVLYLIIIQIVPLDCCIKHALECEDWTYQDFDECKFSWYKDRESFSPMTREEYEQWLAKQMINEGRASLQ
ncbi:hypothetical protein [Vibrio spartinae]|uniref:Uncharacterized protein n=1 Tax=Vibrio spartinae TaxID=1918945 RepID=A0A1N6LZG0_9VIBR|nr:hypothetical protein [Vibrio spartinae]SIO92565.1 hypothetical protein VSP9026_00178 [Vibrio spartinae]